MAAVPKSEWKAYCDRVSKEIEGRPAEVEVASLGLGNQIQAEWVPMIGISYDPRDNIIEVALEGLDHLIHQPRELYAEEKEGGLASLAVVAEDGTRHIVQLREPLPLKPPMQ